MTPSTVMEEHGSTLLVGGCLLIILSGVVFTAVSMLQNAPTSAVIGSSIVTAGSGAWMLVQHRIEKES